MVLYEESDEVLYVLYKRKQSRIICKNLPERLKEKIQQISKEQADLQTTVANASKAVDKLLEEIRKDLEKKLEVEKISIKKPQVENGKNNIIILNEILKGFEGIFNKPMQIVGLQNINLLKPLILVLVSLKKEMPEYSPRISKIHSLYEETERMLKIQDKEQKLLLQKEEIKATQKIQYKKEEGIQTEEIKLVGRKPPPYVILQTGNCKLCGKSDCGTIKRFNQCKIECDISLCKTCLLRRNNKKPSNNNFC